MGVWSYDFVEAQTHDGRKLRLMTLIDEFTRSPPFGASANLTIPCHKDPPGVPAGLHRTPRRYGTRRRDARQCSAQIRIMTGRPPTSRNMLATTFRKLSDTVRSQ
jgi:hypothetical protein